MSFNNFCILSRIFQHGS